MARDGNVLHVFNEYGQAFQALRAPAVTSYFHLPCMLVAPQGVAMMTSHYICGFRVGGRQPTLDVRKQKL